MTALGEGSGPPEPTFDGVLARAGKALLAGPIGVLQLNVGKLCNLSCKHCHVDAGPHRTEVMTWDTMQAALRLLDRTDAHTVDLTGGAPELNPHFRDLVDACVHRGTRVIDRCNLAVLLLPKHADLPEWLGARGVEIVASLPHWRRPNTDAQRGEGAFHRSIEALKRLNAAGYGTGDPRRVLTLVHNPAGAFLPGPIGPMESEWKAGLSRTQGVTFDRLIALNNMPIHRFRTWLQESGNLDEYEQTLVAAFNPAAVDGLMCRDTLSVGWDGQLYDCDFNQMLALPIGQASVHDADPVALIGRRIRTAAHCFGCTAGAGSSCGGATTPGALDAPGGYR